MAGVEGRGRAKKIEQAARLINEARWVQGQTEEARCGLLREAIKVLMRGKRVAQRPSQKISLPSTRKATELEAWLEELLGHPARRLAVYGTLAPGEDHHSVVAHIQGTWKRGWATGVMGRIGVYPAFQWKPHAKRIPVHVLSSSRLAHHWARLDRFEGPAYQRILTPVTMAGGKVEVANIYEGVDLR